MPSNCTMPQEDVVQQLIELFQVIYYNHINKWYAAAPDSESIEDDDFV